MLKQLSACCWTNKRDCKGSTALKMFSILWRKQDMLCVFVYIYDHIMEIPLHTTLYNTVNHCLKWNQASDISTDTQDIDTG